MDCSRARDRLWPPEQPRVASEEVVEARRHLQECAACQAFLAEDDVLLDSYTRLRRQTTPRELRERIFDALARERAGGPAGEGNAETQATRLRPRRLAIGVAAVAIVAAGAGALGLIRNATPGPEQEAAVFVEDYLRRAVSESHVVTSDPEEISQFLTRELGMAVSPLKLVGLEPTEAEVCLLEGRRGAMIVYKKDGRAISHYLIPRGQTRPRPPEQASGARLAQAGEAPPAVVMWATPALEHALVGAIPAGELLSLAERALPDP